MKLSPRATAAVGRAAAAGSPGTTAALVAASRPATTSAVRRNTDTAVSSIPSNVRNTLGRGQTMTPACPSMFHDDFPIKSVGLVMKQDRTRRRGRAGPRPRSPGHGEHEAAVRDVAGIDADHRRIPQDRLKDALGVAAVVHA